MTNLTWSTFWRCHRAIFLWGGNVRDSRVVVSEWRRQILVIDGSMSILQVLRLTCWLL